MIEFNKLTVNGYFYVPLWEIKQINSDELSSKYFVKLYQNGYRKSLAFRKTSDNTCVDSITNTEFVMIDNKMYNGDTKLYFFASYVNNARNTEQIDSNIVREYFEDAKEIANQKEMILK